MTTRNTFFAGIFTSLFVAVAVLLGQTRPSQAQSRGTSAEVSCACNASKCCCAQASSGIAPVMMSCQ